MIVRASAKREARWSNGYPKALYSGSCQPAPKPRISRPPEISSTVSAILASKLGLRKAVQRTSVPSSLQLVDAARDARSDQPSQIPILGADAHSNRIRRLSGNQRESKHKSSA